MVKVRKQGQRHHLAPGLAKGLGLSHLMDRMRPDAIVPPSPGLFASETCAAAILVPSRPAVKVSIEDWEHFGDEAACHLYGLLGLDALKLRKVSRQFDGVARSDAVALALSALKCEPNKPQLANKKSRTPASAMEGVVWDSNKLWVGRAYRTEWASLAQLIDRAPIHTVIDAFLLVPKMEWERDAEFNVLEAKARFLSSCTAKPHRDRSASPVTTGRQTNKRGTEWLESYDAQLARWNALSDDEKRQYSYASPPLLQKQRSCEGSVHTRAVRSVLHKCIEERMWTVISGHDVVRVDAETYMKIPMSKERVLETVKRMLDKDVCGVHNGPTSFFYTECGWLGFTPFLLAAERQNLPLVQYLCENFDEKVTTKSVSQAGNNAYALCRGYLKEQLRRTPEEMEGSEILDYLRGRMDKIEPRRDEYAAWCD